MHILLRDLTNAFLGIIPGCVADIKVFLLRVTPMQNEILLDANDSEKKQIIRSQYSYVEYRL